MAELLWPLQLKRQYSASLDPDLIFSTLVEKTAYLINPRRYSGMITTCLEEEGIVSILNNAKTDWIPVSGGSTSSLYIDFPILQASHGFSVLTPLYYNITTNAWTKAQANSIDTLATHIVSSYIDIDNFTVCQIGKLTIPAHGKSLGYWFTSDSVLGETTENSPLLSNPVFFVQDANTIHVLSYRPLDSSFQSEAQTIGGVKTFTDGIISKVNNVQLTTTQLPTTFLAGTGEYTNVCVGLDKEISFNDGGIPGSDSFFRWDKNTKSLFLGLPDALSNSPLIVGGALDDYLQISIQNTSESVNASSDIVATADSGNDSINYVDLGINSSIYAPIEDDLSGPLDSYLAANGGNLIFFADTVGKVVKVVVEGTAICTIDLEGIKLANGMVVSNRPEVFYGTGSPPAVTGKLDGTLFFKYLV